MEWAVEGKVMYWRGPSPWYFVDLGDEVSEEIGEFSSLFSYGWGVLPVTANIGDTEFTTSLFPKDSHYFLPLRATVRAELQVDIGDHIGVVVRLGEPKDH